MSKASLHERQLIELATHIESQLAWVRLVYDDHHAGDRLALTARTNEGFFELHLWRGSNRGATLHLLTDTPEQASRAVGWMDSYAKTLSWSAGGAKRFANRIKLLAAGLGATHARRAAGFPSHALANLHELFGGARPLIGFAGMLEGKSKKLDGPVLAVQGLEATLWAAAVPIPAPGFDAPVERALLWDPQHNGWLPPREVRVELLRRFQLPDIHANWAAWGFAGPPPAMVEPPIAPIDLRAQNRGEDAPAGQSACDCFWDGIYCVDCVDCGLFDFGGFDCDVVDCIPCDF